VSFNPILVSFLAPIEADILCEVRAKIKAKSGKLRLKKSGFSAPKKLSAICLFTKLML
jgi:hypothetical protein